MAEAGNMFLAEAMLWLMYIALGVAVAVALFSTVRSFWLENKRK